MSLTFQKHFRKFKVKKLFYYIRLHFTVFLLVRSNTRDIPFSNILISKKQFLCNKKSYCTQSHAKSMNEITWHESAIWYFIAQKLLFANQYVRKFHKISKFSKNFKIIKLKKKLF